MRCWPGSKENHDNDYFENTDMNLPGDFQKALIEARNMCVQGKLLDAERIYRRLAAPGPHRGIALEGLAELYLRQQRLDEALSVLKDLVEHEPDSIRHCGQLASLLESFGRLGDASDAYARLLERRPDLAIAHFNQARLLKLQQRYDEALSAYEAAIRCDIDQPEEAYSNMGVIYSELQRAEEAQQMYERALEIAPDHVPALYNLAGHFEESGQRDAAQNTYEQILSIDDRHWGALARLAYVRKVSAETRGLIERLEAGIAAAGDDRLAQETLYFALGKANDDLESYDQAGQAYTAANELGKHRVSPYSKEGAAAAFDRLIDIFDADWIRNARTSSTAEPVFICGMYRSGSTLLERMLGQHPALAAGGELSHLAWLFSQHIGAFPQNAANATGEQLQAIAQAYTAATQELAQGPQRVIDKQPDNILRVGLIHALFPRAKIIRTRRDSRDNCLSLYFQQFGHATGYATDLGNIAHYYDQQERLAAHWRACLDEQFHTVDYETLIDSPEDVLRQVLEFLGLEWDARVLEFQNTTGLVKTASIWQVREGLHSDSKQRWRNYEALLGGIEFPR